MDIMSKILNENLKSNSYITNARSRNKTDVNEKQCVNPSFLMIGQPVILTVTDLNGNKFDKEARVGEMTAGGGVLVEDESGYVADLQWDGGQFNAADNNTLRYFTVKEETGLTYELFTNREGNQAGQGIKTF